MGNIFITSDPHWGHGFMANLRGFPGFPDNNILEQIAEHDETLLENFLSVVTKRDQIWWLGDLAMSNPTHALEMTAKIPGEHHLIWGNHDRGFPGARNAHRYQRQYMEVFASAQPFARRRIDSHDVLLSHFPYLSDHGEGMADHTFEPRYTQYRLPDEGRWLLHGHTHNKDQRLHGGHQIHVGLDAWDLMPVALETIQHIIKEESK